MNIPHILKSPAGAVMLAGAGAAVFTGAAALTGITALAPAAVYGAALGTQIFIIGKLTSVFFANPNSREAQVFQGLAAVTACCTSALFTVGAFALAGSTLAFPPFASLTLAVIGIIVCIGVLSTVVNKGCEFANRIG